MKDSDGTPAVSLDTVCFAYPGRDVLHGVSFTLPQRTLAAVVGPNGGGKTTLLRLLLGELKPECGTISVLGESPQKARSQMGYVPQHTEIDPHFPLSAGEAVLMGRAGKAGLFYSREDREAASRALDRVGLAGMEQRAVCELSGGEWQRVMIAQALAGEPRLLLLDEPLANVDAAHAADLYALFRDLSSSMTVLMVSHNLSVVTESAEYVICVNGTVGMHKLGEVASETFKNAFGAPLAILRHNHCPVGAGQDAPHCPHAASGGCGCKGKEA